MNLDQFEEEPALGCFKTIAKQECASTVGVLTWQRTDSSDGSGLQQRLSWSHAHAPGCSPGQSHGPGTGGVTSSFICSQSTNVSLHYYSQSQLGRWSRRQDKELQSSMVGLCSDPSAWEVRTRKTQACSQPELCHEFPKEVAAQQDSVSKKQNKREKARCVSLSAQNPTG